MPPEHTVVNRSATDQLARLIETELARQGLNGEQAAREARLPADAFRGLLLRRQRPSIDRADELCKALGITMVIGFNSAGDNGDSGTEQATVHDDTVRTQRTA